MSFLDELSNSLLGQLNLAENTPGDLDGKGTQYGKLGDLADKIDKSAARRYLETGSVRNIKPRSMEILMQEPDITVLVKKRMFSSLAENYRTDLMNDDEKLFMKASKKLFYNKCRAIAAYERLTKIERIVARDDGIVSDFVLPQVFSAIDVLDSNPLTANLITGGTRDTLEQIRRVKSFSDPNFNTTWITDATLPYATDTGEGTGVFELTTVSSLNATSSVNFGGGSASLTIQDPYKLMFITKDDIDKAITDATNMYAQNNFYRFTQFDLEKSIADLKQRFAEVRQTRGVSNISFFVNEETILFKKVRAVIDDEGRDISFVFNAGLFGADLFSFDNSAVDVDPQALQGRNGLSSEGNEINLFKQIVQNIYMWIGLKYSTRSEIKEFNKQTNNVRKKMYLHYAGKFIIQPMDVITIFISTKTITDSKVTQGLNYTFSGDTLLNKLNSQISNIESSLTDLVSAFGGVGGGQSYIDEEKNAIAGPEFPTWLWALMRNDFTRQAAGTCVFSGIVDGPVAHTYNTSSNGYTLNVNASDNCAYFKMGQINTSPSVDVFNSNLYDPLTPFELDFNLSSGALLTKSPQLLSENVQILNSGALRAAFGRNRGLPVNSGSYLNETQIERISSSLFGGKFSKSFRRIYDDPDGFVYRWKEGIGSLVMFDELHQNQSDFQNESSPNIFKNPFAGQDVMNALSLLITGRPYNYDTFIRGALRSGMLQKEDARNVNGVNSFYRGLIQGLTSQNATWGNFVPFKKLVLNEREYNFIVSGQFSLEQQNSSLQAMIRDRAAKFDELSSYLAESNVPDLRGYFTVNLQGSIINKDSVTQNARVQELYFYIQKKDAEILKYEASFSNQVTCPTNLSQGAGGLTVFGNDISYDPTLGNDNNSVSETQRVQDQQAFRKKLNYLSQRRLWKVKSNEDQNLFIVDDSYDKNYDIQAFEQTLNKIELFNSVYSNVFEQIGLVRNLLFGFEVFADSQGHIRARAPQYNRMPSSVFYDMLKNRAQKGIQIFPAYLESLFFNKVQGITDRLSIVEDQIRIRTAALGKLDDQSSAAILGGTDFRFITDRDTGLLGDSDIRNLLHQDAPDLQEEMNSKPLQKLANIVTPLTAAKLNFNIIDRIDLIVKPGAYSTSISAIADEVSKIGARLQQNTNTTSPTLSELFSDTRFNIQGGRSQSDIVKITEELAQEVAERQNLIKTLAGTLKNLTEGLSVNNPNSGSAESILYPTLNRDPDKAYPEILASMIEDENEDDYGTHSGQRYLLTDDKIIDLVIREVPPEHTSVVVDGALAQGLIPTPSGLEANFIVGGGGNAMSTAAAVDYDMWKMYGFKSPNTVKAYFFDNPYTQCRPYAVFLLNLARKNIFQGDATVVGNEFIQPGEVSYIDDRDTLFYNETVTHAFTYNSTYTTKITLKYGHNPGEYIPTSLDVIGQGLYSNQFQANTMRQVRHDRAEDAEPLACVLYDSATTLSSDSDALEAIVKGTYGDQNKRTLENALLTIQGYLTPSANGQSAKLEIRIYENSNSIVNIPANLTLAKIADKIKAWLQSPASFSLDGKSMLPDNNFQVPADISKLISVEPIDLNSEIEEHRSPSPDAWNKARSIASVGQQGSLVSPSFTGEDTPIQVQQITKSLVNCVIDIWVTFEDVEQTVQYGAGTDQYTDDQNSVAQRADDALVE
jgi:hypothetical protein